MSSDRQRDDAIEALCRVAELMGGSLTPEQAGRILDEAIAQGMWVDFLSAPRSGASVGHAAVAEAVAAGLKRRMPDD